LFATAGGGMYDELNRPNQVLRQLRGVATAEGTFADGSPAVTSNRAGSGRVIYCSFLPGLSYYRPAIPVRPVDRGSSDDAMCHFLPTEFDRGAPTSGAKSLWSRIGGGSASRCGTWRSIAAKLPPWCKRQILPSGKLREIASDGDSK
jgi:hypothetical protein